MREQGYKPKNITERTKCFWEMDKNDKEEHPFYITRNSEGQINLVEFK